MNFDRNGLLDKVKSSKESEEVSIQPTGYLSKIN